MTDGEALHTYQRFLDVLTPLFLAGEVEACMGYFALPHRAITLNQTLVCTTTQELRAALTDYVAHLRAERIVRLDRRADGAYAVSPTAINGYHVTTAYRASGEQAVPPFPTRNRLILENEIWKAREQNGVIDNTDWSVLPEDAPTNRPN